MVLPGCGTLRQCPEPPPLPEPPAEAAKPCPASAQALPADFASLPLDEQADLVLSSWLAFQEDKRACAERHEALIRYTESLRK